MQDKPEVVVEKVTRSKRKSITTIKGLETFGKGMRHRQGGGKEREESVHVLTAIHTHYYYERLITALMQTANTAANC